MELKMKKKILVMIVLICCMLLAGLISYYFYKNHFIEMELNLAIKSRLLDAQLNLTEALLPNTKNHQEDIKEKIEVVLSQLNGISFLLVKDELKFIEKRITTIKESLQDEYHQLVKTGELNNLVIQNALYNLKNINLKIKN